MNLKFTPLSSSWVALHPQPHGVIQFIGGAFFGSFPTIFYRHFLSQMYAEGYSIIALPFRFSFQHWPIAISLLKEQSILAKAMPELAEKLGYQNNIYTDPSKYFWVGHSLGCKYIMLLEFLSENGWQDKLRKYVNAGEVEKIERIFHQIHPSITTILNQHSLLIAPDISDTNSAIPIPALAKLIDRIGLGGKPSRKQTQSLIKHSDLFQLISMISFSKDTVAGSITDGEKSKEIQDKSDVLWLINTFKNRGLLHQEIQGKHLEPVGVKVGNYIVDLNPLDKFIQPISHRCLEQVALHLLLEEERRKKEEGRKEIRKNLALSEF
ncbi:DUF1350 family protein [Okeania sp. KiyG1]|uniref:DUF1350 family protein n=1 Tax=Okeania sp. KiyG1 TaxID=2720165 RepID=UPI001922D1C1|nr:DUF1350 family protein [Okeania sp. KiyG1]GGA09264.1 hypothetical protein CYANOKiyG1_22190 [Okeania sp. KiyG1]